MKFSCILKLIEEIDGKVAKLKTHSPISQGYHEIQNFSIKEKLLILTPVHLMVWRQVTKLRSVKIFLWLGNFHVYTFTEKKLLTIRRNP